MTMEAQILYYTLRMAVRPGVTGWAQIKSGYAVSQEDVTEKIVTICITLKTDPCGSI